MRRYFILLVIIVLSVYKANGQRVNRDSLANLQPIRAIYKTNPFAILVGPFLISAEYKLKREVITDKQHSWETSFSYLDKNIGLYFLERFANSVGVPPGASLRVKGFKTELSTRVYPSVGIGKRSGIAPHGFFLAPHVSYTTLLFSTNTLYKSGNYYRIANFSVNFLAGVQFMVYKKLTMEFYFGPGIKQLNFYRTLNFVTFPAKPGNLFAIPGRFNLVVGGSLGIPLYRKT